MIRSMTAFARIDTPIKEGHWVVEIRSINHRYFDFSLKIQGVLASMEDRVRELVQETVTRGKISVSVSQAEDPKKNRIVSIHEPTVKLYLDSAAALNEKYKIQGELTVSEILKMPGIFATETASEDPEKIWPSLKKALKRAIEQLVQAKQIEGQKLSEDIESRLRKMAGVIAKVEKLAQGRSAKVYKRMAERIDLLLADRKMDSDRLYREVALTAERSDITEECVRLKSHLQLFDAKLTGSGQVGRELDFLCQEMNREVNTIGSKAQLFEISREVVFLKGELEKIREQIQNVE